MVYVEWTEALCCPVCVCGREEGGRFDPGIRNVKYEYIVKRLGQTAADSSWHQGVDTFKVEEIDWNKEIWNFNFGILKTKKTVKYVNVSNKVYVLEGLPAALSIRDIYTIFIDFFKILISIKI